MPIAGSPLARTASRVAVATRRGNLSEIAEARRDHAAEKLEDYIRRTVAEAPPLTETQRNRLAALLTGGGAK